MTFGRLGMRVKSASTKHSSIDRYLAGNSLSTTRRVFSLLASSRIDDASDCALARWLASFSPSMCPSPAAHPTMRVRAHEARPHPENEVRQRPDARFGAGEQIQIEDKTWLHRADLAGRIAHDEIALLEIFVDRVLDEFVVSAVLCLVADSVLPMPRLDHL